jgi:hypothetical protein
MWNMIKEDNSCHKKRKFFSEEEKILERKTTIIVAIILSWERTSCDKNKRMLTETNFLFQEQTYCYKMKLLTIISTLGPETRNRNRMFRLGTVLNTVL